MHIDRWPIFLLFLLPLAPANSQVAQPARYEIPVFDAHSKPYSLVSLGDQGILVYGTVLADGVEAIEVIKIDTTLTEMWKGYIKLEKHSVVLMAQSAENRALI